MKKNLVVCCAAIFLIACSPKVRTKLTENLAPLDYKTEVEVIEINQPIPTSAKIIGTIKIGDSGFSVNCNYKSVLEKAKNEARKAGGEAIKITKHAFPNAMGSTCHRITANILKISDPQDLTVLRAQDEIVIDSTWNYAKIFIYRPPGLGSLIGYDVYLGNAFWEGL